MNELKRRAIAKGVKVGDLEEEQLLIDTIRASEDISRRQYAQKASDVNVCDSSLLSIKGGSNSKALKSKPLELINSKESTETNNNNGSNDHDCDYPLTDYEFVSTEHYAYGDDTLAEGGKWHRLPYELVDYILMLLGDVDMMGYLLIASRHTFQPSERVYEYLCSIIYLQQTSKKLLQVSKWGSWRRMLYHRPRLRTNGLYVLRTQYSKEHNNDRFWEEKDHRSVEVRFYRCFRFMDHSRVLYSLDVMEVEDMAKLMQSGKARHKQVYEGHYSVQGREVVVDVRLHYCAMRFELKILDHSRDGYIGRYNTLELTSHSSVSHSRSNNNTTNNTHQHHHNNNRVQFSLPLVVDLQFYRFWSFVPNQLSV